MMTPAELPRVYVAYVNVPGYLPMADEPMSAEEPEACWEWLAGERRRDLDAAPSGLQAEQADQGEMDMMDMMGDGEYPADWHGSRTGTVWAATPGGSDHDLGLAYTVREVIHVCQSGMPTIPARTCEACEIIESWEDIDHA